MQPTTAFETCARELEEAAVRSRAAFPPTPPGGAEKFHKEMLDERAQAIREGKWFYGYRDDKETYAEFQKRALAEIGRE